MGVVEQVVVAVEVVFGNIQHHGGIGGEAFGVFELEAGKFEHPHIGFFAFALQFGFEHGRADVAGHHGVQPAFHAQVAHQAGYGGFAVAAGDGDHFVAARLYDVGEDFDVAQHPAAVLFEFDDFRRALADAGAERQHVETLRQRVFQTACVAA